MSKISQFTKNTLSGQWKNSGLSLLSIVGNQIVRNDLGKYEIVMFQSIAEGQSWNKNTLNTTAEVLLKASQIGKTFGAFPKPYRSLKKNSSLINKDCIYAVYADDIGLV